MCAFLCGGGVSVYQIIWYIQIIFILITLGCVYLTCQSPVLKESKSRDAWILMSVCLFVAECGYGFYLQAVTLEGLSIARKLYLIAGIVAVALWLDINASNSAWLRNAGAVFTLTSAAFIASDKLDNYLFASKTLSQNQYFYYIEETRLGLYYIGKVMLAILLAYTVVVLLLKKTKEPSLCFGKAKVLLAMATVLPVFALAMGDAEALRHYPIMAPVLAASAVLIQFGLNINNKVLQK